MTTRLVLQMMLGMKKIKRKKKRKKKTSLMSLRVQRKKVLQIYLSEEESLQPFLLQRKALKSLKQAPCRKFQVKFSSQFPDKIVIPRWSLQKIQQNHYNQRQYSKFKKINHFSVNELEDVFLFCNADSVLPDFLCEETGAVNLTLIVNALLMPYF